MIKKIVIPRLLKRHTAETATQFFHTFGLSETNVEKRVQNLLEKYPFITPAYCANLGHVKLTWSYPLAYQKQQQAIYDDTIEIFGDDIVCSENLMEPIAAAFESNILCSNCNSW